MWTVVTLLTATRCAPAVAKWARRKGGVEPVTLTRPRDPRAWVELYFPNRADAEAFRASARLHDKILAVGVRTERLRDWSRAVRHHFGPVCIGNRLRIVPAWQPGRHSARIPEIRLEPGAGFGTGQHFTTRFCLERIVAHCHRHPRPRSLLDLGTGSGILALAAARLGVRRVVGVDNDAEALAAAAANARRNGLDRRVRWLRADLRDGLPRRRFDLVAANLYGAVLICAARHLSQITDRALIVSGARESEADRVADALRATGLREVLRDGDGVWCGMEFVPGGELSAAERAE
ncbi:MAG: 50S ribosomal protein L11 methyltransferase [Kiritimatiellae bacterium]|nr:50S ribosomal protein L11 methyltransferase [Kiritimatiellia bacterium]